MVNPDAQLQEIRRFLDLAAPFAEKHSKPAYRFRSDQEDALFDDCPDFCLECATKIANRISATMELAYAWLGQVASRMAYWLRDARKEWMGRHVDPYWAADCELDPVRSDLSGMESSDQCGVLLDGYADPTSLDAEDEWSYWKYERVELDNTQLDGYDLANLYYLLHESSTYSSKGKAACDRAVRLLQQLQLPQLAEVS
jgi:hypothetical protein